MSLAEQNTFEFSRTVLKDIMDNDRERGSIYLFACESDDHESREHMVAQVDALSHKLALIGNSVRHVNVRELFVPCGKEYAVNQDALAALEDDRFHHFDLTDEAIFSVHFMRWFSDKGIKLLAMALPVHKKRVLITANIVTPEEGKPTLFSWFKAEQLFYLSRMVFFVSPKAMKLVRCMTLPSGIDIDFISNRRAWMTPEKAALDALVEIKDHGRPRILFSYGDASELGFPSASAQAIAFSQALAKLGGRKTSTIQAHEIMKATSCTIPSISPKAMSLAKHARGGIIFFDLSKMDELSPELQSYTMKVGLPTVLSLITRAAGVSVVLQKADEGTGPESSSLPAWIIEDPHWAYSSYYFFANDKGNVHEVINNFSKNAEVNFVELSKEGAKNA